MTLGFIADLDTCHVERPRGLMSPFTTWMTTWIATYSFAISGGMHGFFVYAYFPCEDDDDEITKFLYNSSSYATFVEMGIYSGDCSN